jgi:hypothetical protein
MRGHYRKTGTDPLDRMSAMLAINGFLEWFFIGLLSLLVAAVTLAGLLMAIQFFRNPGRAPRPRG